MHKIPVLKIAHGCYAIILHVSRRSLINVGSLGQMCFEKGYYVYIGSAAGGNISIASRVNRHIRIANIKSGKIRWHIDYLLSSKNTNIQGVVFSKSNMRLECILSKEVAKIADGVKKGFGSSDCRSHCQGHLYYFKADPKIRIHECLRKVILKDNPAS